MYQTRIIRQFRRLEPKAPEEVSDIWRSVHILLLILSGLCGWATAYAFGLFLKGFDFHCPLFTKFVWSSIPFELSNITLERSWVSTRPKKYREDLRFDKTRWGDLKLCNFVQFLHVCSLLSAIIWLVFFLISGKGSREDDRQVIGRSYRLMFPFVVWSTLMAILIFATRSTLISGIVSFCGVLKNPTSGPRKRVCIGGDEKQFTTFFGMEGTRLFDLYSISHNTAFFGFLTWMMNACWSVLRMSLMIDYNLKLITIWKYELGPEKVQKLVNISQEEDETKKEQEKNEDEEKENKEDKEKEEKVIPHRRDENPIE